MPWLVRRWRRTSADLGGRRCMADALAILLLGACGGGGEGPKARLGQDRIAWTFTPAAEVYYGSPALSADESTVYLGTSSGGLQPLPGGQALQAVATASGALRWSFPLGTSEVRSTPAVAADGSITFVASRRVVPGLDPGSDVVHRLTSDGALLWSYPIGPAAGGLGVGLSPPALAPDGSTYVASDGLFALRPDGTLRWRVASPWGEDLRTGAVLGADGTVYFATHNMPLTAYHPDDGRVLWSLPLGLDDHALATPALGADGTIYVPTEPGILYAVSPTGALRWTFGAGSAGYQGAMRSSPAVAADGTIYLGISQGSPTPALFAVNGDGTLRWVFEPGDLPPDLPATHFDIYSSPAIGADGTVYFGQEFGRVYALDGATGAVDWLVETASGITWSSPALAADGTLFICDLTSRLYAIRTASLGLQAGAPWPRYRGSNQSTGAWRR
jgi:outer membrane protein assembly factor BamB